MNIIDYMVLIVIGISVLFGLYRGFISSVLNALGCIVSFVLSFTFYPRLADIVRNRGEMVRTLLHYTDASSRLGDLETSLMQVSALSGERVAEIVEKSALPNPLDTMLRVNLQERVFAASGMQTVAEYVSQTILNASINILCFILCFVAMYLVVSFVLNLVRAVFRFPLLKQLDSLVGGVIGLMRGALLCYVLFAVVPLVMTMLPVDFISDLMNESMLAPVFNSGTLILSIMNGSL